MLNYEGSCYLGLVYVGCVFQEYFPGATMIYWILLFGRIIRSVVSISGSVLVLYLISDGKCIGGSYKFKISQIS